MANIAFIPICGSKNDIEDTPRENGQFLYTTESDSPNQIYADVERGDGTIDRVSLAGNYLDINGGEVTGNVTIDGDLTMEGDINFTSSVGTNISLKDIFKAVYPVGSIYMSTSPTNPANMFGGSWVAWGNGRVPVGVNTDDTDFATVEKTGGTKSHTLSVNQMPSHNHNLTYSGNTSTVNAVHSHGVSQINDGYTDLSGSHTHSVKAEKSGASGSARAIVSGSGTDYYSAVAYGGDHQHGVIIPAHSTNYTDLPHSHAVSINKDTNSKGGGQAFSLVQPYVTCYMWKRVL